MEAFLEDEQLFPILVLGFLLIMVVGSLVAALLTRDIWPGFYRLLSPDYQPKKAQRKWENQKPKR